MERILDTICLKKILKPNISSVSVCILGFLATSSSIISKMTCCADLYLLSAPVPVHTMCFRFPEETSVFFFMQRWEELVISACLHLRYPKMSPKRAAPPTLQNLHSAISFWASPLFWFYPHEQSCSHLSYPGHSKIIASCFLQGFSSLCYWNYSSFFLTQPHPLLLLPSLTPSVICSPRLCGHTWSLLIIVVSIPTPTAHFSFKTMVFSSSCSFLFLMLFIHIHD